MITKFDEIFDALINNTMVDLYDQRWDDDGRRPITLNEVADAIYQRAKDVEHIENVPDSLIAEFKQLTHLQQQNDVDAWVLDWSESFQGIVDEINEEFLEEV